MFFSRPFNLLPAIAAVCFVAASLAAIAQTVVAEAPLAAVKFPFGDWIVAALQLLTSILEPAAIGAILAALYKVFPAARLFLSTHLVERLVRNAVAYGTNAVEGAVKGRALSVPVGSAVLAESLQYGVTQAPGWLLKFAGGQEGLAEKIFRSLDLSDKATAARLIAPALGRVDAPIDAGEDRHAIHEEPEPDPMGALHREVERSFALTAELAAKVEELVAQVAKPKRARSRPAAAAAA